MTRPTALHRAKIRGLLPRIGPHATNYQHNRCQKRTRPALHPCFSPKFIHGGIAFIPEEIQTAPAEKNQVDQQVYISSRSYGEINDRYVVPEKSRELGSFLSICRRMSAVLIQRKKGKKKKKGKTGDETVSARKSAFFSEVGQSRINLRK